MIVYTPTTPIPNHIDSVGVISVLDNIAVTTLKHLRQGGYLSEEEASVLLDAYRCKLAFGIPVATDLITFIAETQAQKHPLKAEDEVVRMQKLLRSRLNDRLYFWSFGPLPGKPSSLYDHCPDLRQVCMALGCPATLAGESNIVHLASVNPVSALVASLWIGQQLSRISEGESPFIFAFLTDLPSWQILLQRHFVS